jgi:hypothetical protein
LLLFILTAQSRSSIALRTSSSSLKENTSPPKSSRMFTYSALSSLKSVSMEIHLETMSLLLFALRMMLSKNGVPKIAKVVQSLNYARMKTSKKRFPSSYLLLQLKTNSLVSRNLTEST